MNDSNLAKLKADLEKLISKAELLYYSLADELGLFSQEQKENLGELLKLISFKNDYESWYSEALVLIKQVLPERLADFVILYKNDKRKEINFLTYTVSDYQIGLQTTRLGEIKVDGEAALPKFKQQWNILSSVKSRLRVFYLI